MVVWVLTAGIGAYLLAVGVAAQRAAAGVGAPGEAGRDGGMGGRAGPGAESALPESALLEFLHPVLALTGLTFWIFFVVTSSRVFAWIALGVVATAILIGAGWALSGWHQARTAARAAPGPGRAPGGSGHGFPAHLILAHGLAAACTLALVVIAAAAARP